MIEEDLEEMLRHQIQMQQHEIDRLNVEVMKLQIINGQYEDAVWIIEKKKNEHDR